MGRQALAAYLVALRKGRLWSRDDLLRHIPQELTGASRDNFGRYERGELMPAADVLAAWLTLVGGDAYEALSLAGNVEATADDGRLLAAQRLVGAAAPDTAKTPPLDALGQRELAALEALHEASENPRTLRLLARLFADLGGWTDGSPNGPAGGTGR